MVIVVGIFDVYVGVVGVQIDEFSLVWVMGIFICDIMVVNYNVVGDKIVKGICGQVDGLVIFGMIGFEVGQFVFGDVLAWFREVLMWLVEELVMNLGVIIVE